MNGKRPVTRPSYVPKSQDGACPKCGADRSYVMRLDRRRCLTCGQQFFRKKKVVV